MEPGVVPRWACFAIDVSQAFMNAPLEKHHVVVRLPTSVSRDNDANEPVYLEAKKRLEWTQSGFARMGILLCSHRSRGRS